MRSEELQGEIAGLISRLALRMRTDPGMARALQRDTEDHSVNITLDGIEEAIIGLVMLHIQVRRGL